MKRLETERLILRDFQESDAEGLFAYAQNPKIGPAAGWAPHKTLEESQYFVRMFIQADDVWALEDKVSGKLAGSLGLHHDDKRSIPTARMIGYVLAEEFWGRGLMPEAVRAVLRYVFTEMALDIVSVNHFPSNTQSKRVIEKCGFRYEGTLRMAARKFNGELTDHVCYSMTRREYASNMARRI